MAEDDAELLKQVEEELKKLRVSDLLVQMLYTVSSLGYRKLSEEDRDLDQAKLAIESLRALVPLLEPSLPPETTRDFQQLIANLQLAYATAASEPATSEGQTPGHVPNGQDAPPS